MDALSTFQQLEIVKVRTNAREELVKIFVLKRDTSGFSSRR
jgi:hypothetical protein